MDTVVRESTEAKNMRIADAVCRRLRRYKAIDDHFWAVGLGRYSVSPPPGVFELPRVMIGDVVISASGPTRTMSSGEARQLLGPTGDPRTSTPVLQRELFVRKPAAPKKRVSKTRKK